MYEFEYDESEPPRPRRRRVLWFGGAAVAVAVAGALYAAYTVLSSGSPMSAPTSAGAGAGSSSAGPSPVSQQAAQRTAQAFLSDWQAGNYAAAANLTDSPAAAKAALAAYRSGLGLRALTLKLQDANAYGDAMYGVAATVSSGSAKATWSYTTQLQVYTGSQGPIVQWQPDVLAPNLAPGMSLSVQAVAPSGGTVTDAKGNALSAESDPGLQRIATLLEGAANTGNASAGTSGLDVVYDGSDGTPLTQIQPVALTQPVAHGLATTIDPKVQTAAMNAVQLDPQTSIAVIQPSTGYILAIANNDGDNDDALTAQIAPGSTMKVVTSAALLNQGMSMHTDVACPYAFTVTAVAFHNSDGETEPADTPLISDFAASCNNAFTSQYQKLADGTLAETAKTYFGLNERWDIGLGQATTYFTMPPAAEDSELAAESFGQGVLQTAPLAMASVAATVDTGVFHQPILLPGAHQISATALPSSTASQLRSMMRAVVTYSDGTAANVGFGPDVYAKTGTADHGAAGTKANSWMIAYDPSKDVAIACVVLDGGFGNEAAGPVVKSVLDAL
ncbi:hypothetical protein KDL01_36860 [Actinospica durhamensis]|uniref:Penicillin-binding protein n=1 Tax=Actinospica durhamensis TaxID=1508375 RepID=A0A941EYS6_9ACTN|nr:penicillin-binding transpeptidase domain-containing protein [Actinospica durhamensis]MBR7838897.1 hypothetical protein [Actinospica durhamensis]